MAKRQRFLRTKRVVAGGVEAGVRGIQRCCSRYRRSTSWNTDTDMSQQTDTATSGKYRCVCALEGGRGVGGQVIAHGRLHVVGLDLSSGHSTVTHYWTRLVSGQGGKAMCSFTANGANTRQQRQKTAEGNEPNALRCVGFRV
jgi:hypothetical protein